MNNPRQALRGFVLALLGIALGLALSKLSGGSLAVVIAIVLGIGCFVFLRSRRGR